MLQKNTYFSFWFPSESKNQSKEMIWQDFAHAARLKYVKVIICRRTRKRKGA